MVNNKYIAERMALIQKANQGVVFSEQMMDKLADKTTILVHLLMVSEQALRKLNNETVQCVRIQADGKVKVTDKETLDALNKSIGERERTIEIARSSLEGLVAAGRYEYVYDLREQIEAAQNKLYDVEEGRGHALGDALHDRKNLGNEAKARNSPKYLERIALLDRVEAQHKAIVADLEPKLESLTAILDRAEKDLGFALVRVQPPRNVILPAPDEGLKEGSRRIPISDIYKPKPTKNAAIKNLK